VSSGRSNDEYVSLVWVRLGAPAPREGADYRCSSDRRCNAASEVKDIVCKDGVGDFHAGADLKARQAVKECRQRIHAHKKDFRGKDAPLRDSCDHRKVLSAVVRRHWGKQQSTDQVAESWCLVREVFPNSMSRVKPTHRVKRFPDIIAGDDKLARRHNRLLDRSLYHHEVV
jgi:hypothetical protein